MSSLAQIEEVSPPSSSVKDRQWDFIALILETMSGQNVGQRKLAFKSGISKTRLGMILHSNPKKRAGMSLAELLQILDALGISIVQAAIAVDADRDLPLFHDQRFATSIAMLADLFKGLPSMLLAALDEIEGMDGTEVRKEWAGPLRQAVIEKLVKEVGAVMARRAHLSQVSSLGL